MLFLFSSGADDESAKTALFLFLCDDQLGSCPGSLRAAAGTWD
jgi:hypothetical protein